MLAGMNFFEIVKGRRSIRRFLKRPVEPEVLKRIIASATWAPSACDIQGWKFIVVNDPEVKKEMVEGGGAMLIKNAHTGILVLYDNRTDNIEYMDYVQSAAAAIQNMLLTAHYLGLGGCWICHLPPKNELRKIFRFPNCYSPIAYVMLGYPLNTPKPKVRKYDLEALIHNNVYHAADGEEESLNENAGFLSIRVFLRRLYYNMPGAMRKYLSPVVDKYLTRKFESNGS